MNIEPEVKHFDALGLDHRVVKALLKCGLITPTKVQLKCIPIALEKKDILMRAKTGSGKTLAYCLPLIENILRSKSCNEQQTAPKGLILAPTQELIIQINDVLSSLLIYCNDIIKHLALSQRGNHSISNERPRLLEKPDILICTPSRLVSHLSANNVSLSDMAYIVIDEADLIITHDFEADIKKIVLHLPSNKQRGQILMCSATLNPNTIKLQEFFLMHHPIIIDMDGMDGALDGNGFNENKLTEYYFGCKDFNDKFLIIYALFKLNIIKGKCIIFVHNIDLSYRLKLFLEKFLIPTAILNPKLPFNSRQSVIDKFNRGLFAYLITTDAINEHDDKANIKNYWQFKDKNKKNVADESDIDIDRDTKMLDNDKDNKNEYEFEQDEDEKEDGNEVKNAGKAPKSKNDKKRLGLSEQNGLIAYRGVDFREVAAVINFSAPYTLKKYIHRVGRTARAGNYGVAITLVTPREMRAFENIVYYRGESLTNLPLSMHDLDAFRYRCESIRCSITQHLVKQARLNELRMEILNSERLESHFKERRREFELLRHDKMLQSAEMVKPHHSHIPSYMLSNSLLCNQPKNWRKKKSSNREYEATFGQLPPNIQEKMRKVRLRKAMKSNPLLRRKVRIRRKFNLKHPRKEFNKNLTKNWGFFDKSTLIAKHEAKNAVRDSRVFRKPVNSWKDPLRRGLAKHGRRKASLRGMAKRQVKKLRKREKMRKLAKRRKK